MPNWTAALSDTTLLRETAWIVLCWGAPAAGKSTISRALCDTLATTVPRLSSDGINQALIGSHFDPGLRPVIYDGLLGMAESILRTNRGLVLDGTFLNHQTRRQVAELAECCGAVYLAVQVECPLHLRISRNQVRPPSERVPDKWLRDAHARAHHSGSDSHVRIDTSQIPPELSVQKITRQLLARIKRRHGLVRKG